MSSNAAILPEDPALLKAMIAALQAENARMSATIRAHDQLIQTLRLRIAKLKKQAFGKSSEKVEREIEQLELALEDLLIAAAESETASTDEDADATASTSNDTDAHKPAVVPACRIPRRASVESLTPAPAARTAAATCVLSARMSATCSTWSRHSSGSCRSHA
ncbi:transposase [Roseicitreum antarcticum]|uniref:transposase n=1 Tax=Roseicitreum antarcticum TaxID=564137 RepID=UPI0021E0A8F4|nr:transposase [Roseicitreum antarcticum]